MFRFINKVVLVTGGASGVGAACVRRFCREGAHVVIADTREAEGRALADELTSGDRRVTFEPLDVSDEHQWTRMAADVCDELGRVNVLVNNARVSRHDGVGDDSLGGYQHVIAVGQTGTWLGMRAMAPYLRAAGGGAIVNVNAFCGPGTTDALSAAYHASNGAVREMTRTAAVRYARDLVRVNCVQPGYVDAPSITSCLEPTAHHSAELRDGLERGTLLGRMGHVDEIAAAIAFLASDDSSYMTGTELRVDGGRPSY